MARGHKGPRSDSKRQKQEGGTKNFEKSLEMSERWSQACTYFKGKPPPKKALLPLGGAAAICRNKDRKERGRKDAE